MPRKRRTACPVCGKQGSLQDKIYVNNYGDKYRYKAYAHAQGHQGRTSRIKWHYIPDQRGKGKKL